MIFPTFRVWIAVIFTLAIWPAHAKMSQGQRLWLQCRSCHTLEAGGRHLVGPNLHRIVNAPAASQEGYDYSSALKASGIVWNRDTLDRWIERPNNVLKGHRMVYIGLKDPAKRKALISYIEETAGSYQAEAE